MFLTSILSANNGQFKSLNIKIDNWVWGQTKVVSVENVSGGPEINMGAHGAKSVLVLKEQILMGGTLLETGSPYTNNLMIANHDSSASGTNSWIMAAAMTNLETTDTYHSFDLMEYSDDSEKAFALGLQHKMSDGTIIH